MEKKWYSRTDISPEVQMIMAKASATVKLYRSIQKGHIIKFRMTLPKFIITMDGVFRLGMVEQHKDLLQPGDQCIGGGYYAFDFVSNRIILDRESYDFGRPKWHLLDTLKVPLTYRGLRIVYKYDDGFHEDFNVSEQLQIEYYN